MEKQLLSTGNINNGMKALIERHPDQRLGYIRGVQKYIEDKPGAHKYHRSQIIRVINDQVAMNFQSRIIKEAFLSVYYELYPEEKPVLETLQVA